MDTSLSSPRARDAAGRAQTRRLLVARGLRAVGDGCISIVLPLHLLALGYSPAAVGVIATATLLGSGCTTLAVGMVASRWRHRTLLLAASALMVASGAGFAGFDHFVPLLVIAVAGTLNPSSGDTSVFLPLEHAVLAHVASDRARTALFARYSLVGALCAASGALLAAVPDMLAGHGQVSLLAATRGAFVGYALLGLGCAWAYHGLAPDLAAGSPASRAPLGPSRRIVVRLAALFSLDAFAGGFLVQSLLALWLHQRFDLAPGGLAVLFFWTGTFSALSYLVAVRIARRIGLVHTMVFTHLPSSVLLLVVPFVDDVRWVIGLLLVRSALSQMDVPTRSSFVMAVVTPAERAAAASLTSVPRSLAAAASPALAGYLLAASPFAWPLVVAGVLKIVYDVLLLLTCRNLRPPEEASSQPAEPQGSGSAP